MDAQVENAIEIAYDPYSAGNLKSQAFQFISQLREDHTSWQVCLSLFTRSPRASEIVRHVSLEVINNAVQANRLDRQELVYIKDTLVQYWRENYSGAAPNDTLDTSYLQNKLVQTATCLFICLYTTEWSSFFDDFRLTAANDITSMGTNVAGTMLFLRALNTVHDEIADSLVSRSPEELKRNNELKDLIRSRDIGNIASSWQAILSNWRQIDSEVVEICLRNISRWVSWIDISLIVNERIINPLLEIAGQPENASAKGSEAAVQNFNAVDTFSEIVAKKMRPQDKLQMINVLSIDMIVQKLIASPALSELRSTSQYDIDLAESVAKLVNNTVFDIVKILDADDVDTETRAKADEMLQAFIPHLLRFFSDQFDELCSMVIPSLTDLLTFYRKIVKNRGSLPQHHAAMMPPIISAIIAKMKYDETSTWGEEDQETDEAEFQDLRKKLHVLQQTAATIDETLCIDIFGNIVRDAFARYRNRDSQITWRDLDLALHEMYLFGELAVKNGGLYQKHKPSSLASERLIEMMVNMIESELASYPHPAIQLQYMEICVRYCSFFEHHTHLIPHTLESFVRFVHSDHIKVRTRSWYLFHRYIRHLRAQLGNVSETIINAIKDLLSFYAELPQESADDDMSSEENDQSADAVFTSRLYLFEAVGCIASAPSVPVQRKVLYAQLVMSPLFTDIEQHIEPAKAGDQRAVLQVHHDIMALGTLARGYSDWNPNVASSGPPPAPEVSQEFLKAAEAILLALETLKSSMDARSAARFAFSRLIGVLGARVLEQLPRWIDGILAQSSTKDEIATFLRLLDQVVFGFKTEIYAILDSLLTPLLQRVFAGLAEPTTGTDDEIQLVELKREYLNFLLIVLHNDLAAVFISSTNQPIFDTIITTLEHFSRDSNDYSTARLALSVVDRMCLTWGGPDVSSSYSKPNTTQPKATVSSPNLPGFDNFMLSRFSPLTWALLSSPSFNAKDPQARQVLGEIANLQQNILVKTGDQYLTWLKDVELKNLGVGPDVVEEYLRALAGMDMKAFRGFLTAFVGRARGGN
ncbi:Xpo1-domain-containing protein [Viridothelium virens]|uniref:Exportin-T n=1 Tax=Viridothelium virens TaxID=1048519 RepID=A0A6A6H878_VIRVR|nr:Xpo1-domain-containing protein [Viridothelium virens]